MTAPSFSTTLTLPVTEGDHIRGSAEAWFTTVKYGDYECPHCGQAYPIVEELQRRLGNRMRFVYRHFPLGHLHPHAESAAETAERLALKNGSGRCTPPCSNISASWTHHISFNTALSSVSKPHGFFRRWQPMLFGNACEIIL
jgi:hypothetical protein